MKSSFLRFRALAVVLASVAVTGCGSKPPPPAPPPPPPPAAPPPPAPPPPAMTGAQLDIQGDIEFDVGKATIRDTPASQSVLNQVLTIMQTTPQLGKVRVEGHTDNDGKPEQNQQISLDRANAVVKWLTDKGIVAARLSAVGCAARDPLVPNDTPQHKQRNRRTEFDVEEMDAKAPPGFTAACAPNPSRKI